MAGYSIDYLYRILDKYSAPLKKMQGAAQRFKKSNNIMAVSLKKDFAKAQDSVKKLSRSFKTGLKIGAVASVGALTIAIGSFFSEASKIENAIASFTPILGTTQKAELLVDKLNQTAATTPFQFEAIAGVANQLLPAMNGNLDNTITTFRMLGDTAGGNVQKLDSITRGYMKTINKGKADMESMNMITDAGVPIIDQLSKMMGVSKEQIFKLSSQGKISADTMTKVFQKMTSEGGIFNKGMEVASATLSGKMSTLKDNIALTSAAIGMQLLPIIKPLIDQLIGLAGKMRSFVNANKELISQKLQTIFSTLVIVLKKTGSVLKVTASIFMNVFKILKPIAPLIFGIVAAFTAYNAIMVIAAAMTNAYTIAAGIANAIKFVFIAVTQGMTVAQAAFNGVAMANPIGLIIMAIGTLIAIIVLVIKYWDQVTAVMKKAFDNKIIVTFIAIFFPLIAIIGLVIKHFSTLKQVAIIAWNGIKIGFKKVIDFLKMYFFTFVDVFLTYFGTIIKTILSAAKIAGKALGFDTTGLDNVINKITEVQKKVREQSIIGSVQNKITGGGATPEVPRPSNQDISVKNDTSVSVYTEDNMKVKPFNPSGNRGYNYAESF